MQTYYKLFSLYVDSCIHLPETKKIEREMPPDVTVEYRPIVSKMRPNREEPPQLFGFMPLSETCMQFSSVAGLYEISNGNHIAIDTVKGATEEQIRLFLLGTSMGILQTQRGWLPLHGGAVVVNGKAAMITGQAGAGKSTITSALVGQGLPYLTDDVSTVIQKNDDFYILPSYPQRKLVRDACVKLGYHPESLPVVDPIRDKFAIRDAENWHNTPAPFSVIVRLVSASEDANVTARILSAKESIDLIVESLYRDFLQKKNGVYPPEMLKQFLILASKLTLLEVSVPRNIEKLEGSAKALSDILKQYC